MSGYVQSTYEKIKEQHPNLKRLYPEVELKQLSEAQRERLARGDDLESVLGPSQIALELTFEEINKKALEIIESAKIRVDGTPKRTHSKGGRMGNPRTATGRIGRNYPQLRSQAVYDGQNAGH